LAAFLASAAFCAAFCKIIQVVAKTLIFAGTTVKR
jgi:hypothetical protein